MVTDESLTAAGSTRDGIFASHRLDRTLRYASCVVAERERFELSMGQ
jgi:hypothetical protein